MNKADTIIRRIAFYFSLALYFILLPIILSYSLGYHIDFHKFKIYKTGILAFKSTPSGASIYINSKLHPDLTPARIEELRPGTYSIEVKKEGFYPWQKDLAIHPNMVTRAENIVLFTILQEMSKISPLETVNFAITDDRNQIYHMTKSGLYRSNMDGANLKKLSNYSDWPDHILKKKFSPDGRKILYFNENGIWVIYLISHNQDKGGEAARVEEILQNPEPIHDVFWHSGSNYLVFIAGREINVVELGRGIKENIVTLHRCAHPPRGLYYDEYNDSLYFNDSEGGKDRIWRIDLREKFFEKLLQRVKKEFDIIYEKR